MSSHHIVRESQEPALFIWQPEEHLNEQLAQLLEWSPTIILKADALDKLLAQGIKVDVVLCTGTQQEGVREKIASQSPVHLIVLSTEKEMLMAALRHLEQEGQKALNVFTASNSPEESLLASLAEQQLLPNVVILNKQEKWSLYRSGHFSKWLPAGETIQVFPLSSSLSLHTQGFRKNMDHSPIESPLELQVEGSGATNISANGPFWLQEKL